MNNLILSAVFFPLLVSSSFFRTEGTLYYPTYGIINPKEGTIEITVKPSEDLSENINGWGFAFQILSKKSDTGIRTVLGLYHPPKSHKDKNGNLCVRLHTDQTPITLVDNAPIIKANEFANIAITWGENGCKLYYNGKLVVQNNIPTELSNMSPYLQVFDVPPFYVSKLKVSAKELSANELNSKPNSDFIVGKETTMVANDLNNPLYHKASVFIKDNFCSVAPFDSISNRIIRENNNLNLNFIVNNYSDKEIIKELSLELKDTYGSYGCKAISCKIEIPENTVQKIVPVKLGIIKSGFYKLYCKNKLLFNISVLPNSPIERKGRLAEYCGLDLCRDAELFNKLGINWARAWNKSEFCWYKVEPIKNNWDFKTVDRTVKAFKKRKLNILAVLGYPAAWAAKRPEISIRNQDLFTSTPGAWKPNSITEWDNYVYTVAKHFKGLITHYEIYNEIDWHPPKRAASFSGSTQDYLNLLQSSSEILKKVDSSNKVLISGFGTGSTGDENMYQDLIDIGANKYVDIWNMHAYEILKKADLYKNAIRKVSPDMPIWQTEFMWHVITDKCRQAYLELAIHCWYLEKGFSKFFSFGWYKYLVDHHTNSINEPLHSIAIFQNFLESCDKYLGRIPNLPPNEFDIGYSFQRTDGKYLSIIGSSMADFQLSLNNEDTAVYDMFGEKIKMDGANIKLKNKAIYIISAKPLNNISYEIIERTQLIPNSNFENLQGDDLNGIEQCSFESWTIRTHHDKKGSITVSSGQGFGKYSAKLSCSGSNIYLFSSIRLPSTGVYRISGKFKNISGNARPFIRLFEQKKDGLFKSEDFDPLSVKNFKECYFDVEVDKKIDGSVAVIWGIKGKGDILLDEVSMTKLSDQLLVKKDDACLISIAPGDHSDILKNGVKRIDLNSFQKIGTGIKYYGGIPYLINNNWFVVAGDDWENSNSDSSQNITPIKISSICILGAAMYQPYKHGTLLAEFIIKYIDGTCKSIPIRSGLELSDWYLAGNNTGVHPVVKWETSDTMLEYGLFSFVVVNPEPDKMISKFELKSKNTGITAIKAITLSKAKIQLNNNTSSVIAH